MAMWGKRQSGDNCEQACQDGSETSSGYPKHLFGIVVCDVLGDSIRADRRNHQRVPTNVRPLASFLPYEVAWLLRILVLTLTYSA